MLAWPAEDASGDFVERLVLRRLPIEELIADHDLRSPPSIRLADNNDGPLNGDHKQSPTRHSGCQLADSWSAFTQTLNRGRHRVMEQRQIPPYVPTRRRRCAFPAFHWQVSSDQVGLMICDTLSPS